MAKLKDFDLTRLMSNLRVIEYQKGDETIRVEVFPQTHAPNAAMMLESQYGDLKADDIFYKPYKDGLLTDNMLASTISDKCKSNWVRLLEIQFAEYNPLWNVDGKTTTTTEVTYGKSTTLANGKTVTTQQLVDGETTTTYGKITTTEQKVDGTTEVEYGKKDTTEQKVDGTTEVEYGRKDTTEQKENGTTTTTHGLTVETEQETDGKVTEKISAFNSVSLVPKTETDTDAGKTSVTNSGDDVVEVDAGKVEVAASGKDTTTVNAGKVELASSGKDTTTVNAGKTEVGDSGNDTVTVNAGKIEAKNTGNDVTTSSGKDSTTVTEERGGNIGVVSTVTLMREHESFWSMWNFFDKWFRSISEVITIPVYEED